MSLHALADHMASKGRGGDSLLVHMSKDEVAALQALAQRHGKTLTINPETGQPEAFSLKSLLPAIAGFALGPAGFGLMSSSALAGLTVGGVTALATGDISRGLMAGMGAYGGSGLGETLADTGASALGTEAYKTAAVEGAAPEAVQQAVRDKIANASMGEKLSAGFGAATESPTAAMDFAKTNFKPLAAAAAPIMADAMVPTTTKAPDVSTGNIRRFSYDPYSQRYDLLGVYPAKDYKGYATGGIVALADGGPAPGSDQYVQNVKNWFEANPAATAADVQGAMQQYGLNQQDVQNAMQQAGLSGAAQYAAFHPDIGPAGNVAETQGGLSGLSSNINYWLQQNPGASTNAMRNEMGQWELSDADILRATGKTPEQLTAGKLTEVYNPAPGAGGQTGPGQTGGGAVVNPNGTITTSPNIPGIPVGGFTGLDQLRQAYTQGGGSLGQSNLYTPKTIDEFNQRYTNTGGSQQAYEYLMGKGAADLKKPWTPTGELMKPYAESVMGMPADLSTKKYIFDPATKQYKTNPDFKPLSYDTAGKRTVGASANEIAKAAQGGGANFQALLDSGAVTYEQVAAAMGITVDEAKKRFAKAGATERTENLFNSTDNNISLAANGGVMRMALGGLGALAGGGQAGYNLGGYSDGGRLLKGPGDGVSDSIPATIGDRQPARLADGEFVVPARIVSELGNGSTDAGARKLYAMMDRVQKARGKTTGKGRVAANTNADKHLPA